MPFQFAISATFTAEPIETVLSFWGRQLKWPLEVRFAPFNQTAQSLLDPASVLGRNTEGVNVILVRPEDLGSSDELIRAHCDELLELTILARRAAKVPFVFVLCPGSPALTLPETPGITIVQPGDVERFYPVDQVFSAEGDRLGGVAYTEEYFAALGTTLARLGFAQVAAPFKVIALDCDNTLWQGICGEDGAAGIVLDEPRRALQQFMVAQREAGMLLTLASKNNERDVLDVFERRPEMPLRLEHFVSRRLNWEPKSASLASLAEELSLGPDSFLFIDDSPLECAEVQENLPPVLALALPPNAEEIPLYLAHVWAFDHPIVTAEDRRRSESYAQTLAFGRELQAAGSMEHFLDTLNLRVTFVPPTPERLPRLEQLTQRTNQFNFTTIRRTAAEIAAPVASGEWECLGVEVADRFGDYGLTGVLIFRVHDDALEVDTFLLSCRVLGRGVEHRVLNRLAEEAIERGVDTITGQFIPTARNEPARQFLYSVAGTDGSSYRIPAALAARAGWTPQRPAVPSADSRPASPLPTNRPDYAHIARHLASASDILAAMRAEARGVQPAPSTWESETEASLATIWQELLHQPRIKPNDNFFDLGGHSLLVVLLIVRVRETLGVELPIEDVYSGDLTLRSLARTVDRRKAGEDLDYDAMMDEISRMSDEEVSRLLAESE
jgi:FkbH-like protein